MNKDMFQDMLLDVTLRCNSITFLKSSLNVNLFIDLHVLQGRDEILKYVTIPFVFSLIGIATMAASWTLASS